MVTGVFSFVLQQSTSYPWIENPAFAVLFLDAEELRSKEVWGGNDPWEPHVQIPPVTLSLDGGGSRKRRIRVVQNSIQKT
jgi:hypothetical protein